MTRLLGLFVAGVFSLCLSVSAVLAAEDSSQDRSFLFAANSNLDVAAGQHVDALVVINGNATVEGEANAILVINGNATLTGAHAETVVVVNGTVNLDAATVVTGDVRTIQGTVSQDPGATVQGSVGGLEAELATLGIVLVPALLLFFIGLALVTIVAALVVAALGARQVRSAEWLIRSQPGPTLLFGVLGSIVLPLIAVISLVTVIGAPLGLVLLFLVLPAVAYLGWIVAAIWIGDWLVQRIRGAVEPERPYLAAVIGVIVLGVGGLIPLVTLIASLFGFGAVLLLGWRVVRHEPLEAAATMAQA